ncbi:MAG: lytic transglycosylase domain-containing protein [Burkholderiales bacterium]|nr:MAG: lytic transglycosylase domain-containing protein [Burkholderiales bacterium]
MATAALTAGLGAQAAPGCDLRSDEDLLTAPAATGSRFALTERLCGTTLTRTPSMAAAADALPPPSPPTTAHTQAALPTSALPPNPPVTPPTRDPAGAARIRALAPLMADVARRHDIDPLLLHAVAHIESRHQAQAISPAGARGLMQVMPATGRSLGVAEAERELMTPEANLEASARYLKRLQARFGNDLRLVLAAYNAGEGAVERYGRRVPPFAETQAYVSHVIAVYAELRRRLAGGMT